MSIDLYDAREKLRWAKHHFALVKGEIETFQKDHAKPSITVDPDFDAGKYIFHVSGIEELGRDCGLMIGDCLHNARTALDYLMIRLVATVTDEHPRDITDIQFPIYYGGEDPAKRFNGDKAIGQMRQQPAFRGYATRIEELQPYNNANPSIWGAQADELGPGNIMLRENISVLPIALERLARFDNIDKHRVIHGLRQRANWVRTLPKTEPPYPAGFTRTGGYISTQPLEDGAEVGSWQFQTPLPSKWLPSEVEMKRAFPLQIEIDDETPWHESAFKTLGLCIWGVEVVLDLFQPVFDGHLQPPLPVTSVPSMPESLRIDKPD